VQQETVNAFSMVRSLQPVVEVIVIVGAAVFVNFPFLQQSPVYRVNGVELEWLTSSAHFASSSLREHGYIPLWQPYNDMGEPLIESPFSFVLNPISTAPSLLLGGVMGIRVSVVLYGIFAGLGGYFLARMLGLQFPARMLLAALMIGKGNMLAMIGTGFFQLGVTQAYFPWIIGAGIAVLRRPKRWPVVLLAVMFTLLFWAGNIWYTLPMLFALVLLTGAHLLPRGRWKRSPGALRRMLMAGVLTIGLSAVTLLPIYLNASQITRHNPEPEAGMAVDPLWAAQNFVDGNPGLFNDKPPMWEPQFYYALVAPFWFVALVLLILPPIGGFRVFSRSALPQSWRIWGVALFMLIGTFIWGVGGNPLMIWLYDVVPGLARWRFVGRALAVASFFAALLLALRVDSLWRLIYDPQWLQGKLKPKLMRAVQVNLGLVLIAVCALAGYQMNASTAIYSQLILREPYSAMCLAWLRDTYPDRQLAAMRYGYEVTTPFLDTGIRQMGIEADYTAAPLPSTIGNLALTELPPRFGIGIGAGGPEEVHMKAFEYRRIPESPEVGGLPCAWERRDALEYAYSVPYPLAATATQAFFPSDVTEITALYRLPDRIALYANADPYEQTVVTIQERAYPGWRVSINGLPATLEVLGGQVGVLLPPGTQEYAILFEYRPPLFFLGGALTLGTWAFCILYLLRAERLVLRGRRAR
jgi:hypothetical protein